MAATNSCEALLSEQGRDKYSSMRPLHRGMGHHEKMGCVSGLPGPMKARITGSQDSEGFILGIRFCRREGTHCQCILSIQM